MSSGTLSSSRIIIKNLPSYFTEEQLKEHFSKRLATIHNNVSTDGLITDIKLVKDNRTGNSRRFAFIGFKNEDDASDAIKFHNNSFIHTAKIEVSLAKSFVDPSIPTPMKLKRQEALRRLRDQEEKLLKEKEEEEDRKNGVNKYKKVKLSNDIDKEVEKNKQLKEFMETMNVENNNQNKSYKDIVQNSNNAKTDFFSDAIKSNFDYSKLQKDGEKEQHEEKKEENNNEEEEEEEDFNPLLATVQKTNIATSEKEPSQEINQNDDIDFEQENNNEDDLDDLAWFKSKRTFMKEGEDKQTNTDNNKIKSPSELEGKKKDEPKQTAEDEIEEDIEEPEVSDEEKNIQKIKETGRLFLRNILYDASEEDFKSLFSKYGPLEEVHIALDTRTGKSKGFAYILFKNPDDAVTAYIELDKQIYQGRLLHIIPGDDKKSHALTEFDLKNMPLKKQKELKRKHDASKSTFQWNSLYLNQDAVLETMANKLGLQKNQLIDAESSNSAVKQALAEAAVINDVRTFFESKGVDLKNFNKQERDDTVILIKNFPFGTTMAELAELFLPFGVLKRFIMPLNGVIAILQYRDQTSARSAFQSLSYKRFKDGILYLEKGPKNCFNNDDPSKKEIQELSDIVNIANKNVENNSVKTIEDKVDVNDLLGKTEDNAGDNETADANDDDAHTGPTVSIFVKNLNFSTTSDILTQHFKPIDGFLLAQVKTKPDPKNKNRTLSMGFGFVEYKTKQQADIAISTLNNTVIEGHKIQLKISHRQGTVNNNTKDKKKPTSKIIVKNLPFEASRKDIYELFSSFGQLKSVRVPKKFDKSARGFAFVEFLLPKEAESAMDQLAGVHLLGRRLVMQYAELDPEDADSKIEKMTQKVRKQFNSSQMASKRNATKGKFTLNDQLEGEEEF
ncbi:RNA-binding domain-containing protein [Hanseniaspora valbyensis NRRL Y-1626]|uniref:Multiple RNA-binding domain-containing protein 1 n=1 Tax=Hanseniaspora valbyensis NRRL Y-1626 TaxID=766949 RepID=A0A1B7TFZ4_9ASCO|nr:RNA-binding domain-containing protein [Hanseniaspora valbyensis NRRL Y-1626]